MRRRARVRSVRGGVRPALFGRSRFGSASRTWPVDGLPGRMLGLERLEQAQRAPELRQRRAAIAQQRLKRPGAIAVANQGEAGAALRDLTLFEQLDLDAIRPREPPGGNRDPPREARSGALRPAPAPRPARLRARANSARILVRQHEVLLRAHAVFQRVLRGARLAIEGFRAARLRRRCFRLGLGAGAGNGNSRARARRLHWTWREPFDWRWGGWRMIAEAPRPGRPRTGGSLTSSRNIVQECVADGPFCAAAGAAAILGRPALSRSEGQCHASAR